MTVNLESAKELHRWNKRVLSIGGMWPCESSFLKFYIGFIYFIIHVVMAIGDFVSAFGDMTLMISNLSETSVQAMLGIKMLVFRHSVPLKKVIMQMESDVNDNNYRNETEKRLYLSYNTIGKTFFRIGSYLAITVCLLCHFKPFEDILKAVLHNETMPFVLPYRMQLFFNMRNTKIYVLVYLSQTPMIYYYYCHTISICFIFTLIVHVAGDLSVLAHRIRNIKPINSSNDCCNNPEVAFRDIVKKHRKMITTAKAIDDIFNIVLLEELLISTMLIGLGAYSVLSKSLMVSVFEYIFFINYCFAFTLLIFAYCIIGEYLISESINVHNAYYECQWYEMPTKYQKQLLICMSRAQNPLELTAGRFYVFSLSRFSSILKTSLTYISMLRTVV